MGLVDIIKERVGFPFREKRVSTEVLHSQLLSRIREIHGTLENVFRPADLDGHGAIFVSVPWPRIPEWLNRFAVENSVILNSETRLGIKTRVEDIGGVLDIQVLNGASLLNRQKRSGFSSNAHLCFVLGKECFLCMQDRKKQVILVDGKVMPFTHYQYDIEGNNRMLRAVSTLTEVIQNEVIARSDNARVFPYSFL